MTHALSKSVVTGARAAVARAIGRIGTMIRGLGFWTGILLPLVYVPLLLLNHSLIAEVTTLGKVIVVHVAALFLGKGYGGE